MSKRLWNSADAVAERRDIDIEYATISVGLNIRKIKDRLELENNGNFCIKGNMSIIRSEIRGHAHFNDTNGKEC